MISLFDKLVYYRVEVNVGFLILGGKMFKEDLGEGVDVLCSVNEVWGVLCICF